MQMLEDKAAGIVFPAVVLRDVTPSELADIAEPQVAVAGEQVGVSDRFVSAGRGNQPFHLVYRQIVSFPSACLGSLMAGKQVHRVGGIAISVMDKLEQNYDKALALLQVLFSCYRYPVKNKKIIFVKNEIY